MVKYNYKFNFEQTPSSLLKLPSYLQEQHLVEAVCLQSVLSLVVHYFFCETQLVQNTEL